MANAIGNNSGRFYSFGQKPVLIDCNFIVDPANGNGYGVRSLKGQGIRHVYMHSTASLTGTTTSSSNVITSIAGGTSGLTAGMPVQGTGIPAGTTITAVLSSSSVQISANATSSNTSESITYQAAGSPNPAPGYALIRVRSNYNRYLGGFSGFASPTTGGTTAINSTTAGLTIGNAYIIASVGHGPAGTVTIAPVADVNGSLASTYFTLYDSYGNVFVVWFSVSGVGSPPNLGPALSPAQLANGARGLQYVQQTIATNASAATIGAALVLTIQNLPSGINGTFSFTASGTTTVTVVSTANAPVAGIPQDGIGAIPSGGPVPLPIWFTISSGSATAGSVWTDGSGNLYTVSTTLSSGTTLKTSGTNAPTPAAGTLTFVSGTGSTTALTYSSAQAGLSTGFTFAQTVSDTNLADWQAVGLPKGLTPSVGQSFIATSTGAGGSTGTVIAAGVSGITSLEVIGDPNLSIAPAPQGGTDNVGGWILVQLLAPTSSSVTTPVATAPTAQSTLGMSFYMDVDLSPSNINSHI